MLDWFDSYFASLEALPKEQRRKKMVSFYKKHTKALGLEYIMVTDDEINAKDYTAIHKLMSKCDRAWRSYQGKIMLNVDGYNHIDDELHEIPEVVAYFKELYLEYPHYLGYLDVSTESRKLAVRLLADQVEMLLLDENEIEATIDYLGVKDVYPDDVITDEYAIFHSVIADATFATITKGIMDWYNKRHAYEDAIKLIKEISKDVEIIRNQ